MIHPSRHALSRRVLLSLALVSAALGAGCKSAAERESERLLPAIEALAKEVPSGDPKEFVRTAKGYADTLARLEQKLAELRPPPSTPAAEKIAPIASWIASARAEHTALEQAFAKEVAKVEVDAQADLAGAVSGGETKPADQMVQALTRTNTRPIVLWHGAGGARGFDKDHQNLPAPARRAVDPGDRFVVGYVQRVNGEGTYLKADNITLERKMAYVTLYELPSKRRLGVFTVKGETARLPAPLPPPGTVLPGLEPPLIESLLGAP